MKEQLDLSHFSDGFEKEEWPIVEAGEVLRLEYGEALPNDERVPGDYPVFGTNGQIDTHNEHMVSGPGIIVGRKGQNLGVEWSSENFNVIDTAYYVEIRDDSKQNVDLKWLYYFLKSIDINRLKTGSAVPGLNRDHFYDQKFRLPPMDVQREFADFLSNLDNKQRLNPRISNNLIGILDLKLEKMVSPHLTQGAEIQNCPEEWRAVEIGDICSTRGGGTPKTDIDEYWGGDILWLTPSEVTSMDIPIAITTERKLTEEGINNTSAKVMPENSILLTSRATVGELVLNKRPMATNQGFICIDPDERIGEVFLLHMLKYVRPKIESLASGSTYPEISQRDFKQIEILLPPREIRKEFNETGKIIYSYLESLVQEDTVISEVINTVMKKRMPNLIYD